VQSTCAKSQFSAAHKRSVDERGGWGKVDRLHSSKINLAHTAKLSAALIFKKFLFDPSRVEKLRRECLKLTFEEFFFYNVLNCMILLNFLKLIYFLRSWAGKGWIRAIPRSFGASNSCHCHGRRPHFGTCLTSLWLRKQLFSQRGNFSRLASTRKHRQQVHASEMRDVRKAHKSKPKRSDTSLKSLLYAGRNLHGEHADETQVLIGFRVRLH
jgi:hypothetical protein